MLTFLWRKNQIAHHKYEELRKQYDLCVRELGCYRWSERLDDEWKIRVFEYIQNHRDERVHSIGEMSENQLQIWVTTKAGLLENRAIFK